MEKNLLYYQRKSHIEIGQIYFWTATIRHWIPLLKHKTYKDIIVDSLCYLSVKGLIDVYAFVIMPNHLHLIWRVNSKNGRELPSASFIKFTAHKFKKLLKANNPDNLLKFKVDSKNKSYEFWQRDSLAVPLKSKNVAIQKLDYIHNNPLAEHWGLVTNPSDYWYSSARYYEMQLKEFQFLKHLIDEF